jgi:hypothetical protein
MGSSAISRLELRPENAHHDPMHLAQPSAHTAPQTDTREKKEKVPNNSRPLDSNVRRTDSKWQQLLVPNRAEMAQIAALTR